ncbi:hypothetical protein [Burkholderia ubonensis]|uniref:hypothetical protein n=1 Tax=Burkholderia ubonensis TaxID=101571 RepID=UPI000A932F5B|nr:hypothetical protein [Burkholderia ubonensis]
MKPSRITDDLHLLAWGAVFMRSSCLYAAEIPEEAQSLVQPKTDARHTLMPPFIIEHQ